MLESLEIELKRWGHNRQTIKNSENAETVDISSLIQKIDDGFYKIKRFKYNIEAFNLETDDFSCDNLFKFLIHYKLTEIANLKYPIIINNGGQVVDGRHRICKAILQGKTEIDAIQILDSEVV